MKVMKTISMVARIPRVSEEWDSCDGSNVTLLRKYGVTEISNMRHAQLEVTNGNHFCISDVSWWSG